MPFLSVYISWGEFKRRAIGFFTNSQENSLRTSVDDIAMTLLCRCYPELLQKEGFSAQNWSVTKNESSIIIQRDEYLRQEGVAVYIVESAGCHSLTNCSNLMKRSLLNAISSNWFILVTHWRRKGLTSAREDFASG